MRKLNLKSVSKFAIEILNDKKFRVGFDIIKNIAHSAQEPSFFSFVEAGANIFLRLSEEHFSTYAYDFFDSWQPIFDENFSGLITSIIVNFPQREIKAQGDGPIIKIHDFHGFEVGYISHSNSKEQRIKEFYCKSEEKHLVEEELKKHLAKKFNGQCILLKKSRALFMEDVLTFVSEPLDNILPSDYSEKITADVTKFLEKGYNRSILLHGPPGTGKSTIARSVIKNLGLKSFRIRLSDIADFETSILRGALALFQPEVIILDDLDRCQRQHELLEIIEMFNDKVKLVLATANNTEEFDPAVIRPGRFDELILIENLDKNVILSVLGKENEDLFEQVKEWPIVFVSELRKNLDVYGDKQEVLKMMRHLAKRIEKAVNNNVYRESEEWQKLKKLKLTPVQEKIAKKELLTD